MRRAKKGPKLSASMREAVAIAKENGGHLNRYTGGVWNGPAGHHAGVPTQTVRALVLRGVFKWGRRETNAAGSFPVDAVLAGSEQAELFPAFTPEDDRRHRQARFLLVSAGWVCDAVVQDGRANRLERWRTPDCMRQCIVDFYVGGEGVAFYWKARTHTPQEILNLNPVF